MGSGGGKLAGAKNTSQPETSKTPKPQEQARPSSFAPAPKPKETKQSAVQRAKDKIKDSMDKAVVIFREKTRMLTTKATSSAVTAESLMGNVSVKVPSTAKVVRIFTSSTFTDTKSERNILMKEAYPQLKTFCQELGYEFQVVDMRWGVRDDAMDDHSTTNLCLRELQLCQELSTGPNFVCLLSHKYGYTPLPKEIEAGEFETLFNAMEDGEGKNLIRKWYARDNNAVPPQYVLSPISAHLPDYVCNNKDRKTRAKDQWWKENDIMQGEMESAAVKVLGEEEAKKYIISVTEKEVQMGILSVSDPDKHCLWFRRNIKNIENQTPSKLLSRYIECLGDEEKWTRSRNLLKDLKDERMTKRLPKDNVCTYTVNWTDNGIDPTNRDHDKYLKKLTKDFVTSMCTSIKRGIQERTAVEINDPLCREYLQHISFCQEKCENFHGREDTLSKIKTYIKAKSSLPLIVHGQSGCGKTSLLAMAAKLMPEWMNNTEPVVVLRFVGTTPDSSNINSLLVSIVKQIKIIYGYEDDIPENLVELTKEVEYILGYAKSSQPLVLILDSLDQMDTSYNARSLFWIPRKIPTNVKMIFSTLEDDVYECFPKLKAMYRETDNFVSVPKLTTHDVKDIVEKWLISRGRTLTTGQMKILMKSFDSCPLPLLLKLSFDEACRWHSYWKVNQTVLQTTVKASIESLFSRLEVHHGEVFVSRALGYLTAARTGLSEAELEDVVSCDDDVLNDVYMFWTPPMRRLPPLLLVRLKTDLRQYIVERGADGIRVMYWYHRQFIETAQQRYCKTEVVGILHKALAEFFSGTWSEGKKKPYKDNSGNEDEADRHVVAQPMQYLDSYNFRKLNNLPYHWTMSGDVDALKRECLVNYNFIQTKLIATSVRQVLDDYSFAKKKYKDDKHIDVIGSALELSQEALIYDPLQLTPQLLDRLAGEEHLEDFLSQCKHCPVPYLMPDQEILMKPGGQLIYCLSGHQGSIVGLDISGDGKVAVTCCEDDDEKSVKTWDIIEGRLLKSHEGLGESPYQVKFVMNDKLILTTYGGSLKAIQATGEIAYSIKFSGDCAVAVAGKGRNIVGVFKRKTVKLYDLKDGKLMTTVEHQDTAKLKFCANLPSCVAESENYSVIADDWQRHVTLFDFKQKTFKNWCQIFDKKSEKEVDALVMLPDETAFILSSITNNSLMFYDRETMTQTKVIQGFEGDFAMNYRITHDGKKLYFPSHEQVVVWDLQRGERSTCLIHPGSVRNVLSVSWKFMVTTSDDTIVRIWDLQKEDKKAKDGSPVLGHSIRYFKPLANPRYVAVLVQVEEKKYHEGFLKVYDLFLKTVVRQAKVDDMPGIMKAVSDKHILFGTRRRKVKIVNLDTMKVEVVCEGVLSKFSTDVVVIKDGKELLTNTRGRMHFKTYDIKTGKTKGFLKQPITTRKKRFEDDFHVNKNGTIMAACLLKRSWMIFDLVTYRSLKEVTPADADFRDMGSWFGGFSYDGTRFAFSTYSSMKDSDGQIQELTAFIMWDTRNGKAVSECLDKEQQRIYFAKDNRRGLDVSVEEAFVLDETRLLTSHHDYIMRVWEFKTGQLLRRLEGHTTSNVAITVPVSPYFCSSVYTEEENSVRIWDKATLECLASYKLDQAVIRYEMCVDGFSFLSSTKRPNARLLHWTLRGVGKDSGSTAHPQIFSGKACNLHLELDVDEDDFEEPDDPDSDVDEKDSSQERNIDVGDDDSVDDEEDDNFSDESVEDDDEDYDDDEDDEYDDYTEDKGGK